MEGKRGIKRKSRKRAKEILRKGGRKRDGKGEEQNLEEMKRWRGRGKKSEREEENETERRRVRKELRGRE